MRLTKTILIIGSIFIVFLACQKKSNSITHKSDEFGDYAIYIPNNPQKLIVLVHGYPWPDDSRTKEQLKEHVLSYADQWREFSDVNKAITIIPQMGSGDFAGYRQMFGYRIDPGDYIEKLVDHYSNEYIKDYSGKFTLYGHSAGAQFAVRYAITRPEKLDGAIISAPSTYPFPNESVNWPYGFKAIIRDSIFNGTTEVKDDSEKVAGALFSPKLKYAIRAVDQIPICIVIGSGDTLPRKSREGLIGNTRMERAYNWASIMNSKNSSNRNEIKITVVKDVGHEPFKMLKAVHEQILTFYENY